MSEYFSGLSKLLCPLCLKFIYKCTTTACGHSYCEKCLDDYLIIRNVSINKHYNLYQQIFFLYPLYLQHKSCLPLNCIYIYLFLALLTHMIYLQYCFICEEVTRTKPLVSCFSIDNIIDQLITKSNDETLKQQWQD